MKFSILSIAAAVVAVATAAPLYERSPVTTNGKVVIGYFAGWTGQSPSSIDFTKLTHINYAFGMMLKTSADPATIVYDPVSDGQKMTQLVTAAHAGNVQVLMSVGGWTGSQTFSTVAGDSAARTRWINNALVFVKPTSASGYNMDGIDIDWEYPGTQGASCNIVSSNDASNYLTLLGQLRTALDSNFPGVHKLITAAVSTSPYGSQFANAFDWVNIMAYDVNGPWSSTTGPNAPFDAFTSAANAWKNAGFPASKIVVGVPFYGRTLTATVNMNNQNPLTEYVSKSSVVPKGGPSDTNVPDSNCNEGSAYSGVWNWNELRTNGGPLSGAKWSDAVTGWTRHGEWAFRASDSTYLTFDSPDMMNTKGSWIYTNGFRGAMIWELSNDYNNELLTGLQAVFGPVSSTTTTAATTTTTVAPTTTTTTVKPTTTTTTVVVTTTTTTTVKPTTTTTTVATTTTSASGGSCAGIQTWTASGVYVGGTVVQYQGNKYTAQWWTTNEVPGTTGQWGVWSAPTAC